MIYLYSILTLYDFISTWLIITLFGVPDMSHFANWIFAQEGGWAFAIAIKIAEILGMCIIVKLRNKLPYKKPINYIIAMFTGIMLGAAIWNTYVFVRLWHG